LYAIWRISKAIFIDKNYIFNAYDILTSMILAESQKNTLATSLATIACRLRFDLGKIVFACCLVVYITGPVQAQSLADVVSQAIQTYPSVLSATARAQASKTDIDRARSAHYPQIGVNASSNFFSSGKTPDGVQKTSISPALSLNLWSGGRIEAEAERAEALSLAAEHLQASTLDEVALLAAEAYINWGKTADLYSLSVRNVNAHKETLSDILKISEADRGRRVDYEQALVRMENAKLAMQQRKSDFIQSIQRIQRFWPGEITSRPKSLTYEIEANGVLSSLPLSLSEAVDMVSDDLPAIAQAKAQLDAAHSAVRLARGNHWPTVDLTMSRQLNTLTRDNELLTQIQMTAPLYNGGGTSAQVQGAMSQVKAAEFELEEARILAREGAALAWQEWISTSVRAETGSKQSLIGDELIKSYRQQFRIARRSLLDLLNIQADAFNYSSSARAAFHDELLARVKLLAATGNLARRFSLEAERVQPQ
jgi:outer membrane protein, adhesin transport system